MADTRKAEPGTRDGRAEKPAAHPRAVGARSHSLPALYGGPGKAAPSWPPPASHPQQPGCPLCPRAPGAGLPGRQPVPGKPSSWACRGTCHRSEPGAEDNPPYPSAPHLWSVSALWRTGDPSLCGCAHTRVCVCVFTRITETQFYQRPSFLGLMVSARPHSPTATFKNCSNVY